MKEKIIQEIKDIKKKKQNLLKKLYMKKLSY